MNQQICNVDVTPIQLQTWLSDYFRFEIRLHSCTGAPIAAGQGFTSSIIRVHLTYEENQPRSTLLPKSVIIKSPNKPAIRELLSTASSLSGSELEKSVEGLVDNHEIECETYRVLNIDRPIPVPKLYAATSCHGEQMGVMVMEDLGDRAEAICDPSITLTLDQLEKVVEALADLHAWCMNTNLKWEERFESIDSERRQMSYAGFRPMMVQGYAKIQELYPETFKKLTLDKILDLGLLENLIKKRQRHSSLLPEVVVHGDFYANNLMFEKQSDNRSDSFLAGIVDWQLCHRGQGMEDLARLMAFNVSPDTRRKYTNLLLRKYYDSLVEKTGNEKMKNIPFENILKIYEDCFVSIGVFYVALIDWLQGLFE